MSFTTTVACADPFDVGANTTLILQLFPGARLVLQVFVSENSSPEIEIEVIFRLAFPVLVSVTFFGLLIVPTF